ncbi:CvpA family protein [Croceibacter atlanticus]|uniref:CvpA family protein n=1 Tax=Croceibacter atlanticus TaxID=313588 RepID=UPI002E115EAB|nr:CvpA family protein [Croceibacter atlanticus]
MNFIDIILGIFLLLGLVRGFMKGFFIELASLVALIAGIFGAIHFSYYASSFIAKHVDWEENYINLAAFAVTFIIIIVIISLAGKLLTKLANIIALGILNKLLGGAFGVIKMAFLASVIILFFEAVNSNNSLIEQEKLDSSVLYAQVSKIAPLVLPSILKEAKNRDILDKDKRYIGEEK